jgi:hypothetical protein
VRLDYSRGDRLGTSGSIITWPTTKASVRLDVTLGPEAGTAEMFYTSRLQDGLCGIYREGSAQMIEVSFDTERLPFLGLWLCYGGWPNDGNEPRQYAVALEPTTSPRNTLVDAQRTNTAVSLKPGETYDWEILFTVREARASGSDLSNSNRS